MVASTSKAVMKKAVCE